MINLHWHSHFSLLDATASPKEIISIAKKYSQPAIALTDYRGLYGAIEFYQIATKENIKPIIGVDLPLVQTTSWLKKLTTTPPFITLLAKNYSGYRQLLSLVSKAHTQNAVDEIPLIQFTDLENLSDVLILVGAHNSILWAQILSGSSYEQIKNLLIQLQQLVGSQNLVLEAEFQDHQKLPIFATLFQTLTKLAKELNLPIVASSNYHYWLPTHKEAFLTSLQIKYWAGNIPPIFAKWEFHIKDDEQILQLAQKNKIDLDLVKQMIQTTHQIAEQISIQIPLGQTLFPDYQPPQEIQELYTRYKYMLDEIDQPQTS